MEKKLTSEEFSQKVMEGLRLATKKLVEKSRQNNETLVVSINNKIEKIYPK